MNMTKLGVTLMVSAIILGCVFILALCVKEVPPGPVTTEQIVCEHEFVTTSKYNWLLGSYKTFSKCIKCGEEF